MTVYAPTAVIRDRGDTLNRAMLTVTFSAPAPGVVKVRVERHAGCGAPGAGLRGVRRRGVPPRDRDRRRGRCPAVRSAERARRPVGGSMARRLRERRACAHQLAAPIHRALHRHERQERHDRHPGHRRHSRHRRRGHAADLGAPAAEHRAGRARLRPRRAVRRVREERPDRRHVERRRRHLERAGVQERAVLPHEPRLRRLRRQPRERLVRGGQRGELARAVLGRRRVARVLRDRRSRAEGRAASLHRTHRASGARAGVVVRAVADDILHRRATTKTR